MQRVENSTNKAIQIFKRKLLELYCNSTTITITYTDKRKKIIVNKRIIKCV